MSLKVLTPQEIEQFMELGYVRVPQVFSSEVAEQAREFLWKEMDLNSNDPSTWKSPSVHLQKSFDCAPFTQALTQRFWDVCDDTVGENRWNPFDYLGWWPVTFPGFHAKPWTEPVKGWHVDGQQFHHHLNSPNQGLLTIFLFSDIAPGGGGTALSVGSHKNTAHVLAEAEPEGLDVHQLAKRVGSFPRENVVEATGQAGDVYVMHPFVLHSRSKNCGDSVRFICNPCVTLREPMNLQRPDATEYSPVERAIVQALETDTTNV